MSLLIILEELIISSCIKLKVKKEVDLQKNLDETTVVVKPKKLKPLLLFFTSVSTFLISNHKSI